MSLSGAVIAILLSATLISCETVGGKCDENQCNCEPGYMPNSQQNSCVGGVDQRCLYDEHCIPGAFCMNQSKCRCKQSTPEILKGGMMCADSNSMHNFNSAAKMFSAALIVHYAMINLMFKCL